MKNKDIHKEFPQAEIRDFLANQYERAFWIKGAFQFIGDAEKEIAKLRKQIIALKNHQAVSQLIEAQGWETWDISNEVPYNQETYFPFVGTEEEYNALLETIRSGG